MSGVAGCGAAALAAFCWAASDPPGAAAPPRAAAEATTEPRTVARKPLAAAATCSNYGCHGSADTDAPAWRRAYSTWAAEDPHAGAYRVLFRQASQQMVAKLNGGRAMDADSDAYRRFVDARCAACHATVYDPGSLAAGGEHFAAGVTCGACHGEPTPWLEGHLLAVSPANGNELSVTRVADGPPRRWGESRPEYGLRDLGDPVTRARSCVGCHVGSSGEEDGLPREVNHDLIAAGHPRLAFEQTSHFANLPPHWETAPPQPGPSQEAASRSEAAHAWAVGQLVAADAAVDLLASRTASGVWPEFSEYSCANCHHALRGVDTRDDQAIAVGARRGTVHAWGGWYLSLPPLPAADPARLRAEIAAVADPMAAMLPDKPGVRAAAQRLRESLRQAIAELDTSATASRIEARLAETPAAGWDRRTQVFLLRSHLLAAAGAADPTAADPTVAAPLRREFLRLEPPEKQNGPLWLHSGPSPDPRTPISNRRDPPR